MWDFDYRGYGASSEFEFYVLLFLFGGDVKDVEGIDDEVALDLEVEGRVGREGRGVVDFDDPGLKFFIKEDVKSFFFL